MRFLSVALSLMLASGAAFAEDMPHEQGTAINSGHKQPEAPPAQGALPVVSEAKPAEAPQEAAKAVVLKPEDRTDLARIETYLGHIKTLSASFSQISPDGGNSAGKFYLQRPGKLRMEYDPPIPVLVVTSKHNIVYYDKELDQVSNIPLSNTLVGFLARDKVQFDDTVIITQFRRGQQTIRVSLVQKERPKDGSMTLEFSDTPLSLRNIIMTDSGGESTIVSLADARFDEKLDPELFIFRDPHPTGSKHIKK